MRDCGGPSQQAPAGRTRCWHNRIEEEQYRASVVFRLDNSPSTVTYTLLTNPIFVTLPPCRPRTLSGVPSLHGVHERELLRFKRRVWSVTELKGYTPEDATEPGYVTVVNATGK